MNPIASVVGPATPIGHGRPGDASAELVEIDGRTVVLFRVGGTGATPGRRGGEEEAAAEVVARALDLAAEMGVPVVGVVNTVHVDPRHLGGLHAWGQVAHKTVRLSGVVPLLVAVTGPCHGGLAPLLGLVDHVVFTEAASAFINGPHAVEAISGIRLSSMDLGGPALHASGSGLVTEVVADEDEALTALADILAHLPDNNLADPPVRHCTDPVDRRCALAATIVPADSRAAYDVRHVIADVVDEGSLHEVYAAHAPNMVTAYAHLGGRPVAVIANQPFFRAGTLDIAASSKAARHVQSADSANLPILTFVDTPGFEPGRDLEWAGMIRHGAELVHAYAAATVPRIGVILRKAYGGAYIVMDSKDMGSDVVFAWPRAEIAVMGASGAVAILNRREIDSAIDPEAERRRLVDDYTDNYCTPRIAAERGYVDAVIEPELTRAHLTGALSRLATKQVRFPTRRHSNTPL